MNMWVNDLPRPAAPRQSIERSPRRTNYGLTTVCQDIRGVNEQEREFRVDVRKHNRLANVSLP